MHFRTAERTNRAYGPAQRIAEWLHPGRREAPPLIPSAASELVDSRIVPGPASLALFRLAADAPCTSGGAMAQLRLIASERRDSRQTCLPAVESQSHEIAVAK
jgi:hypothetical protein